VRRGTGRRGDHQDPDDGEEPGRHAQASTRFRRPSWLEPLEYLE
jgi:hypothetical protein